jgi:hypothetical protein
MEFSCFLFSFFQGPSGFKGSEGYLGEEGTAVSQGLGSVPFIPKNTAMR